MSGLCEILVQLAVDADEAKHKLDVNRFDAYVTERTNAVIKAVEAVEALIHRHYPKCEKCGRLTCGMCLCPIPTVVVVQHDGLAEAEKGKE